MDLTDAKVLVTGGSEGIGRGIAAALAERDCEVVITGRDADKLEAAGAELGVGTIQGDVGDPADVERTMSEFISRHGRIDILVNNAGFGRSAPLVELELADLEAIYRTNVYGAFLMAQAAAKHFIEQGSGNLINIASTAGTSGYPGGTAYASSKFALRGMTECWRAELRRHNVRVMLVNPSEVQTAFFAKAGREQERSEKKLRPEEIAAAVVGILEVDDRGFVPELAVFATNPF